MRHLIAVAAMVFILIFTVADNSFGVVDIYLDETFDAGIPSDWTNTANGSTTIQWDILTSVNYGSGAEFVTETPPFAGVDSDELGSVDVDTDLITPEIVIPANSYLYCNLEYDLSFRTYNSDSGTFSYTIDGGMTWMPVLSVTTADTKIYESQYFDILEILGAAGGTIQFKWNYTANYGYHMAIDNVVVLGTDEDIYPPEITNVSYEDEIYAGLDAAFSVTVTDPSGISGAWLNYQQWDGVNNTLMAGGYSGTIAMTAAGEDTMTASIPGSAQPFAAGDIVAFWFTAADASSNTNTARFPENEDDVYTYKIVDDAAAPEVTSIVIPTVVIEGEDITFEFRILDDNGISAATFYYGELDTTSSGYVPVLGGVSGTIDMTVEHAGDIYTAVIPGDAGFEAGDVFGYYIEVTDNWTTPNTVYVPDIATEDYSLCEVLSIPDVLWDFETGQGSLVSSDPDVWQYGGIEDMDIGFDYPVPEFAWSGANAWATVLGKYDNDMDGYLTSTVAWTLSEGAVLRFMHWYHTETCDGHNVQISLDRGATWTVIQPEDGYTDDSVQGLDGEPGFNGYDHASWHMVAFDLSSYADEKVMFRFRFGSDTSVTRYGAAIDDFMLWGAAELRGELIGTVADPDGAALEAVSVKLYPSGSYDELASATSDAAGSYSFSVYPGTYDIVARAPGFLYTYINSVEIVEDIQTTLDIEMTPGTETRALSGSITDADTGLPLPGCEITARETARTVTSDDAGFYTIDLPLETFTIEVKPGNDLADYHGLVFETTITEQQESVDITLQLNEILTPANLVAEAGSDTITLSFDAPADIEDQPVSGYRVKVNGVVRDELYEEETITVTGLTADTAYELEVAADYGYDPSYWRFSAAVYTTTLSESEPASSSGGGGGCFISFSWR